MTSSMFTSSCNGGGWLSGRSGGIRGAGRGKEHLTERGGKTATKQERISDRRIFLFIHFFFLTRVCEGEK